MEEIKNKVSESGLITIDLESVLPNNRFMEIDLKPQLYMEMALKEKSFREYISATDWSVYTDSYVAIYCSNDAIIPTWAFMLITSALQPYAKKIVFGNRTALIDQYLADYILNLDTTEFKDKRVVIKGCSNEELSMNSYMQLVQKLQPVVKSLMFGEPCSTVPIFKKK